MEDAWLIFIRSLVTIIILFLITRVLGKKQIAELTLYDYIVGIVIGSLAADTVLSLEKDILNGIVALLTYGLVALLLSFAAIKSEKANIILNGKPRKLMENGKFNLEEMQKAKFNVEMFLEECRTHGVYDISRIDTVYLENSGKTSVLLKSEYQNLTLSDIKSNLKSNRLNQLNSYSFIIDGSIQYEELEHSGKTKEWLLNELRKKNLKLENILLASFTNKLNIFER